MVHVVEDVSILLRSCRGNTYKVDGPLIDMKYITFALA